MVGRSLVPLMLGTGEPFLGEFLSSIVEVHRNPPLDLAEP